MASVISSADAFVVSNVFLTLYSIIVQYATAFLDYAVNIPASRTYIVQHPTGNCVSGSNLKACNMYYRNPPLCGQSFYVLYCFLGNIPIHHNHNFNMRFILIGDTVHSYILL